MEYNTIRLNFCQKLHKKRFFIDRKKSRDGWGKEGEDFFRTHIFHLCSSFITLFLMVKNAVKNKILLLGELNEEEFYHLLSLIGATNK